MSKKIAIEDKLVKSDSAKLPKNFVAVGVQLNKQGEPFHSGLIIGVNGVHKLFHFDFSDEIMLQDIPNDKWYFHKELSIIKPSEANVFLQRCKMIQNLANPRYGYFYDGSYYDENAKLVSKSNDKEYTNCVLFCINVILGFIESESYIEYTDWSSDKVSEGFYNDFLNRKKLFMKEEELTKLRDMLLRIPPLDYISTAYKDDLPVRRHQIIDECESLQVYFSSLEMLINTKAS